MTMTRLYNFFDTISCRICRSSVKSATIRFSLPWKLSTCALARVVNCTVTGECRKILARYTHRVAISNHRLLTVTENEVTKQAFCPKFVEGEGFLIKILCIASY
jgi:hypothetical protein